jgi:hypothetical protein
MHMFQNYEQDTDGMKNNRIRSSVGVSCDRVYNRQFGIDLLVQTSRL